MNELKRKVLGIAVVLMGVAMLVAPVFAAPPIRGTFSQGIVEVTVSPGESFMTGDIEHTRGTTTASYLYGAPYGNSLPDSGGTMTTLQVSHVTLTGRQITKVHETYATGTSMGTVNVEIVGIGPYTYMGPTFSFDLPGVSGTVTQGDTYLGILVEGFGVKHGVSGDLKGLETKETFTGVVIWEGPLAGVSLVDNTVTYKLPG